MPRRLDPTLLHAITPPAFDKGKLHRAVLVDRIQGNLHRRLTVVAAPAGYGKTTILADLATHSDVPICWVSLSEESKEAGRLAELVAASIQKHFRRLRGKDPPSFFALTSAESTARVLAQWIEDGNPDPFVLVIDDADLLGSSEEATKCLDEFLRVSPAYVSTIIACREIPELSLARLMAEGELAGMGPHDLALSVDEVAGVVSNATGRVMGVEEADRLFRSTQGWVTGVLLSSFVAREAIGGPAIAESMPVYQYLASVVLNRLPDDLRRFCLDASVLPIMTHELCDSVLSRRDSARMLSGLVRKAVFVDATQTDPRTYVFQSLFRSFLENTLGAADADRQSRLRQRAGRALEQRGFVESAFQLLAEVGDYRSAARLAERHAPALLRRGRAETLEAWWESLQHGSEMVPVLLLNVATLRLERGNLQGAEDAIAFLASHLPETADASALLRLDNIRAGILYQRGRWEDSLLVADSVVAHEGTRVEPEILGVAHGIRALSLAAQRGDFESAFTSASKSVSIFEGLGDKTAMARALLRLSFVHDSAGDFRSAVRVSERAYSIFQRSGPPGALAAVLNDLADGRYKQGGFDEALVLYSDALKQAHQAASPLMEAAILYGQADIYNDLGAAMEAAQLYGEALSIAAQIENHRLLQHGCLRTCSLYRRRGNLTVAKEWMKRALAIEGDGVRSARASIELAALEGQASPRNAANSLRALLGASPNTLSLEDKALAHLFLGHCLVKIGAVDDAKKAFVACLEAASIGGAEQALAAELAAAPTILAAVNAVTEGDPVLEIVMGRVDALGVHRKQAVATAKEAVDVHSLVVSSFGAGRMTVGHQLVRDLKPQAREVLFYLIDLRAIGKEVLAEAFWPQHPPGRRSANIHSAIHSIRKVLGRDAVLLEDGVYLLNPDLAVQYDVEQFERAADVAQRLSEGDPRRIFALNEAVNSYRGPFLSEMESHWAVDKRRTLEQRYLDLVAELATEALVRDQPRRALDHLRRALAIDPFRDDLHIHYLEALGRLGNLSEISTHYNEYAKLLRDELSTEPSESLRKVYHQLIG